MNESTAPEPTELDLARSDAAKYQAACYKMAEDLDLTRKMLCVALTKLGGEMSVTKDEAQAADNVALHSALSPITNHLDVKVIPKQ